MSGMTIRQDCRLTEGVEGEKRHCEQRVAFAHRPKEIGRPECLRLELGWLPEGSMPDQRTTDGQVRDLGLLRGPGPGFGHPCLRP